MMQDLSKSEKMMPGAQFHVEVIDTYADFLKTRGVWEHLQERDPEATVFLTWQWMAEVFKDKMFRWSVLIVRSSQSPDEVVCILPLKYRIHWSNSKQEFHTELEAGGRLLWSEYTGFLCDPRFEDVALGALAAELINMPWVRLSMRYVAQPRRTELFMQAFPKDKFAVRYKDYLINNKETNNLACPQVDLPETFESYLQHSISASKRQKYARFKRRHMDTGEFQIRSGDDLPIKDRLDILLGFWEEKWRPEKGKAQTKIVSANYRDVLEAAHRTNALFLPTLWKGTTPVGALGHVSDAKNGVLHFIVAGRDTAHQDPLIGAVLHFYSIERAIEKGYICYDFCHGNEAYKYSYGAQDQMTLYFEIRRRGYDPDTVLDPISIGQVLKRTETLIRDGKTEHAMKVCAQLSTLLS